MTSITEMHDTMNIKFQMKSATNAPKDTCTLFHTW